MADRPVNLTAITVAELIERVDAGEAYVNLHTVAEPAGAIRGQVTAIEGTEQQGGWFTDDDGNLHETNIDVLASPNLAITLGCDEGEYCPQDTVTRGQIASFLYRALNLRVANGDYFTDDEGSVHEDAINAAAEAGVLVGVGDGQFAPGRDLSRAQYASLLSQGLGLDDMGAEWPHELKQAGDHVFGLGLVLGGAIDDQFGLEGDVTSGTEGELNAADVRTTLTDLGVEHTLLTGVTTGAALRGETEVFANAEAALEDNTVEVGATVGAFYGDDAEDAFLTLWRDHIGYFVDYTNGVAEDDESQKQAALENLRGYQQDIGALFEGATEGRV